MDSNIIGKKFGKLVVVDVDLSNEKRKHYICDCDCGNTISVRRDHLIRGETRSCGCERIDKMTSEMVGKKFGKLRVIRYDHRNDSGQTYWLCKCDCGNTTLAYRGSLLNGSKKSCGCLFDSLRHGMSKTRLHNIWINMLQRCRNENSSGYERYGGNSIIVCDEWYDFRAFRDWALDNGYADDLSIDRINPYSNYCPENCRWVDVTTQANNRRDNHFITYCENTHTISEWSRLLGISYSTLWYRVTHGNMHDFAEYFGVIDPDWYEG